MPRHRDSDLIENLLNKISELDFNDQTLLQSFYQHLQEQIEAERENHFENHTYDPNQCSCITYQKRINFLIHMSQYLHRQIIQNPLPTQTSISCSNPTSILDTVD